MIAAEARADVHYSAPRCLLGLFYAATAGLADWSEFDAEAERWGIDVRGHSREESTALIRGLYPRDPYHRASQAAPGS